MSCWTGTPPGLARVTHRTGHLRRRRPRRPRLRPHPRQLRWPRYRHRHRVANSAEANVSADFSRCSAMTLTPTRTVPVTTAAVASPHPRTDRPVNRHRRRHHLLRDRPRHKNNHRPGRSSRRPLPPQPAHRCPSARASVCST